MTSPELFRAIREAAAEARNAGGLPDFLAELERLRVEAMIAIAAPAAPAPPLEAPRGGDAEKKPDRVLSVAEAATRLGKSAWYVRKHKERFGLVRLPGRRYGFSDRALSRWISRNAAT
jgi:hypothetical protein